MASSVFAKDVVIKGIPDEITDNTITEWCAILIERIENQKLMPPQDKVEEAQIKIDTFRKLNSLEAKYEVAEEVEDGLGEIK